VLAGGSLPRRESASVMSDEPLSPPDPLAQRVRTLAELLAEADLLRIRIERDADCVEVGRRSLRAAAAEALSPEGRIPEAPPVKADAITADLVGIFHLSRPAPAEGEVLEADRELAYIEALGIRNPVRSRGAGRILAVKRADGEPVEYGSVLFEIDRG
jgi:biotin carboxyl carrier protein